MASKMKTPAPSFFTEDKVAVMMAALNHLADLDPDHAVERNGKGFGIHTSGEGHWLAQKGVMMSVYRNQGDVWQILFTHRRQLSAEVRDSLGMPLKMPKADRGPGQDVCIVKALKHGIKFDEAKYVRPFVAEHRRKPRTVHEWRCWLEGSLGKHHCTVWVSEADMEEARPRIAAYEAAREAERAADAVRFADMAARAAARRAEREALLAA